MKKLGLLILVLTLLVSGCGVNNQVSNKIDSDLKSEIKKSLPAYKVAFASVNKKGGSDIWIADVDGSNEKQLTSGDGQDIYPEWSSNGEFVYYTGNKHGGALELYRVNSKGEPKPVQLSMFGKEVRSISLSKDNSMIALGIMSTNVPMGADLKDYSADLFVLKMEVLDKALASNQMVTLEDLELILSEPEEKHIWHEQPCFQKTDEENPYIAYVRTENYDNDPIMKDAVYLVKADGSDNMELLSQGSMPQWTFDDKHVVTHEFMIYDLASKTQKKLKIDGLSGDAGSPSISPDGKYVIFESSDRKRLAGVSKVVLEGDKTENPIVVFSKRPVFEPRWSPVPIE
ncbi:hypothetical protein EZV73_04185 [Acidaminobacter sp. JC074]|uniref:DPP IV N-terminal domain-containing protein n=1 Tax=Acidaminobacter sp. JC074 TaxID=2530199 RepID=UPI001F0DE29B|nr:DPP IV N-terminal domain-containing protein [Acidaminobacter sp. JC074]MCH4886751.1 hypothetical protein [Acidaminobacter sp. JC074]